MENLISDFFTSRVRNWNFSCVQSARKSFLSISENWVLMRMQKCELKSHSWNASGGNFIAMCGVNLNFIGRQIADVTFYRFTLKNYRRTFGCIHNWLCYWRFLSSILRTFELTTPISLQCHSSKPFNHKILWGHWAYKIYQQTKLFTFWKLIHNMTLEN